ncbi:DUF6064 family protein [Pelagibius sp. Alg239-R121]|uniref:DUF6064 family protein n=1 Tax=Pelagibius sp. Alg239-R121 TaxID=2993448 RepID=UPI0024A739B2|nr:DUF6064 family protein [Pelagibius sp. Alg239-R121]
MIPFSPEVFFSFLAQYNAAIWPFQILAYILAGIAIFCALKPAPHSGRCVGVVLTAFWLWTGSVYHLQFFASINFWDQGFGVLFILQGLAFVWRGLLSNRLKPIRAMNEPARWLGLICLTIALIFYPLASILAGQDLAEIAWVGVSPTGTVVFTLGILCFCQPDKQKRLLIFPLLCCLSGALVAYLLPMPQDWVLLPLAFAMTLIAFRRSNPEPRT